MGVISPNYWTKSWTLTSSVPFNRLKCNHFDLCQNRGEDLGFDPPSPRRLSPRIRRKIFSGGNLRRVRCYSSFLGMTPRKTLLQRGITLDVYKVDPVTSFKCSYGAFLGGRKLYNLTRMDGYGLGFIFGFPPWTSSNLSLSEKGFKRQKNNRRLGSGSNLSSRKAARKWVLYIIINYQPPKLPKLYPNNARFFTGKSLKNTTIIITF